MLQRHELPWQGTVPPEGLCVPPSELRPGDVLLAIEYEQDITLRDDTTQCDNRDHPGYAADALVWTEGTVHVDPQFESGEIDLQRFDTRLSIGRQAKTLAALCSLANADLSDAQRNLTTARELVEPSDSALTDPALQARAMAMLAKMAIDAGSPDAALANTNSQLAASDLSQRWLDILASDAHSALGNYTSARARACAALNPLVGSSACAPEGGSSDALISAIAANRLGLLHHRRGELIQAQQWYESALARYAGRSAAGEAETIGNLGGIASVQGRYGEAIQRFEAAAEALGSAGQPERQVGMLNNLGAALIRRGNYERGLSTLRRALELSEAQRTERMAMSARMLLADLLRRLGRPAEGLGYIQQALASPAKTGWRTGLAHVEVVNGRIQADLGDHRRASQAFERAMAIYQSVGDAWSTISTQISLSRALTAAGDIDTAKTIASAAHSGSLEHGFARHEGEALLAAGLAALSGNDLAAADDKLNAAMAVIEDNLDLASGVELYVAKAELARRGSKPTDALHYLDAAFELADNGAKQIAWADDRAFFESTTQRARDLMLSTLLELGRAIDALEFVIARQSLDSFGRPAAGFSAIQLQDALARAAAAASRQSDPMLAARERQRAARLLLELREEREAERAGRTDRSELPAIKVTDLQANLPADGVYLHYSGGEPKSHLWIVRPQSAQHRYLPGDTEITTLIAALRDAITHRLPTDEPRQRLSDALLPELNPGEQLFIAADGRLAQTPFAVLGHKRYLIEDHSLTSLPNTALLLRASRPVRSEQLTSTVFADPVYDGRDMRLPTDIALPKGMDRLPFTTLEADTLAKLVPTTSVIVGASATRQRALTTLAASPDILHLATHGRMDSLLPEASGLFFSEIDEQGEAKDGLLTLVDLYRQPVTSRLIVLSACDTAAGAPLTSEGSLSLARAFLRQGATEVVATLWPVADQTTAQLMDAFYRGILVDGQTTDRALRSAQLTLLSKPRTAHPFYWAGYTVAGRGQPLRPPTTR